MVFISERNFRIQLVAAALVLWLGVWLGVKPWEFVLLLLLSVAVLVLELVNSVIERMADGLSPRLRPIVRDIKDMMAGTVLLAALASAAIGLLIFLPLLTRVP